MGTVVAAGLLRERVRFQSRPIDENGEAGPWDEDGLLAWARVVPLKGSEPVLQQRLLGVQPVAVTIRWSLDAAQITAAWRMLWRGQIYNIKTVVPEERRRLIDLLAEADQTPG